MEAGLEGAACACQIVAHADASCNKRSAQSARAAKYGTATLRACYKPAPWRGCKGHAPTLKALFNNPT